MAERIPVAMICHVCNGVSEFDSHTKHQLLVLCDDGSLFICMEGNAMCWEELAPIPGTKRYVELNP